MPERLVHQLAQEALDHLDILRVVVVDPMHQKRVIRLVQLVTDLDEIIGNLNEIALEAFRHESENCECGMHGH